jgi:pyrroloquinoline quinone biosynthesis protein D
MSEAVKTLHEGVLKLARGHRVQFEPAQGCDVLLYPEGVVQLNESAAIILKQVDGKRTAAEVAAELNRQFPGEDLTADVQEFLEIAYARGWIA